MTSCMICLKPVDGDARYHGECLKTLFGTDVLPSLDVELSTLYKLAATKMAGKMSISGAQDKISLTVSPNGKNLRPTEAAGRYILKPEIRLYPLTPQNEHLTMRLANLVSIETPPFGLIRLSDDSMAYVIKRFDRLDDGTKLHVEDFCQLGEKPMRDKYRGSAELCVRILRKYAREPMIEIRKFYRLLLFSWWSGNGDMHLKNFSLIKTRGGIHQLSPAYDLLCTQFYNQDDPLALPMNGRDRNFSQGSWLKFADYCGLPRRAAKRLLAEQVAAFDPATPLVSSSYLPDEMKEQYLEILRQNTAILATS
jgi:serine/threonine-protein kinase HipA